MVSEQLFVEKKEPSLFKRVINLIHSVWPKTDETNSYRALSRFRLKAEEMIDGRLPDDIIHAASLFEEAIKIVQRRMIATNKITSLEDAMLDIESFAKLQPDESKELKNLLETFLSVTKDRNELRHQLIDFDKGVDAIAALEDDAIVAIPKIQDSERMYRILKQDVGYIEGERVDLEYERDTLISGMAFAKKITLGSIAVLILAVLMLGYMSIVQGNPVFYQTAALTMAAILVMFALYAFRRRIVYELKINSKKQTRAVELKNKKIAVLAYHTNFLNYAYKKYKVRNSRALIKNLSEYDRYKSVINRLDSIRSVMFETENRIEKFLRDKNIDNERFNIEQFAKNIDIEDKQKYYKVLEHDKLNQLKLLRELELRYNDIWGYLEKLKADDTSGVIEAMSQMYLDEVMQSLGESGLDETLQRRGD